jgi:hypothetical protein
MLVAFKSSFSSWNIFSKNALKVAESFEKFQASALKFQNRIIFNSCRIAQGVKESNRQGVE